MNFFSSKNFCKILAFSLSFFLVLWVFSLFFRHSPDIVDFENSSKLVFLIDNGLSFDAATNAKTIGDFLSEKKLSLRNQDQIIPGKDSLIYPGMNIEIRRAAKVKIEVDGKKIENYTLEKTIGGAVLENGIKLGRLDKTDPDINSLPYYGLRIIVTRINVEEKIQNEDIDFKIVSKNDSQMGWREKKITTPGEKGIREVKYKITYKDGKEVSRVVLSKSTIKEPVTQVETQGTYVKVGKANKGQGTWYAYQGGMFAASTSIARGGYARVTNTATGKSIIVQINDYGPQGKGRIIDLDKVAFQKIAPLGAGVIGVKVEEVLN